jgi:hypothetical protein
LFCGRNDRSPPEVLNEDNEEDQLIKAYITINKFQKLIEEKTKKLSNIIVYARHD